MKKNLFIVTGKMLLVLLAIFTLLLSSCGSESSSPEGSAATDSTTSNTTITSSTNSKPTIKSVTANPTSVQANGSVSLSCTATDNDNDPLTYTWSVSGGSLSSTDGQTSTWTAPTTTGNYTATCSVTDGKGHCVRQCFNNRILGVGNKKKDRLIYKCNVKIVQFKQQEV